MQSNSLTKPTIIISSRVIGVLVLIFVETMLFSALLSSYFVMKKGREIWDSAGSVHLPVLPAAFNTVILLAICLFLILAGRSLKSLQTIKAAKAHLFRALLLSGFFIAFQAYLGIQLMQAGLTLSSSVFGGCYHLIVGGHLVQAILGVIFMAKLYQIAKTTPSDAKPNILLTMQDQFNGLQVFWLFVTVLWPVIYAEVYF